MSKKKRVHVIEMHEMFSTVLHCMASLVENIHVEFGLVNASFDNDYHQCQSLYNCSTQPAQLKK